MTIQEIDSKGVPETIKKHLIITTGLSSLTWEQVKEVLPAIIEEIDNEASKHPSFREYFHGNEMHNTNVRVNLDK